VNKRFSEPVKMATCFEDRVPRWISCLIPPAKFPAIHAAGLAACGAKNGVKAGVIENPTKCKFDPGVIECKGPDSNACLTASQVEGARKLYAGPTRPINFDSDVALSDKPGNQPVNAIDSDIKKFVARGGKMLLSGGRNDAGVPPLEVVNYYNNVVKTIGAKTAMSAVRL
jgi:feruloyl esterase